MRIFNQGRRRKFGCLGCLGSFVLMMAIFICVGGILFAVFLLIRQSEPFEMALLEINQHETAVSILGEPIEAGWLVTGSIETSDASGNADFSMPVSGPKAEGRLFVVAVKSAGVWEFSKLVLEVDGERVPLLLGR